MALGYIAWTEAYGMVVVVAPPAMMGTPRTTTMPQIIYGCGAARERTCCSWLCCFFFCNPLREMGRF
jgi:hypothetical protein